MALISLCGVPGSGKTLNATRIALKHYKHENNIIKYCLTYVLSKVPKLKDKVCFEYYLKFPKRKINNVYSNYPILLDKRNHIYSNKITLWDLNNDYSFEPNACIIIDEVQLYADSDEYKDKEVNKKLGRIAKFLQAHRHYGVKTIIFTSQNPSRIFKKARNICESYFKQCKVINIPFTPISIMRGIGYYDLDFYGRFIPKSHEEKKKLPFDYYKKIYFFNRNMIFKAYDSRYLSNYNYNKPLLDKGVYSSPKVSFDDLDAFFSE